MSTGPEPVPADAPPPAPDTLAPTVSAPYVLVGSYETVQVLSPTLINDVQYCTIQTQPSLAVAALPVQKKLFDKGAAVTPLTNFANAIEQILADPRVVDAVGSQSIDKAGLLADNVVFTVEYTDPVHAPYGATAPAIIPVGQLDFSDAMIGRTLLAAVKATIDGVYANLKAAAGG